MTAVHDRGLVKSSNIPRTVFPAQSYRILPCGDCGVFAAITYVALTTAFVVGEAIQQGCF